MKGALMSVSDRLLLRKRAIIETVNDELKNIAQVEHPNIDALAISQSTHQGQLLPIAYFQRSRASMCKGPLIHSLHCSEFVELTLNSIHVHSDSFVLLQLFSIYGVQGVSIFILPYNPPIIATANTEIGSCARTIESYI